MKYTAMKEQIKVSVNGPAQAEAYKKILIALGEPISSNFYAGYSSEDTLYFYNSNNNWVMGCSQNLKNLKEITLDELVNILTKKYTGHKTEDGVDMYVGMPFYAAELKNGVWKYADFEGKPYTVSSRHCASYSVTQPDTHKAFSTKEAALAWIAKQERIIELDDKGSARIKGDEIIISATNPRFASILISRAEFMKIYKALLILVIVLFASCAKEDPLPSDRTTYRVLCDECTVDIGQQGAKFQVKGTWQHTADMLITNPKMTVTPLHSQRIKASITPGKQVDVVTDKPVKL